MAEHDSTLYCKPCHTRQFGLKGYGYGGGAGTLASEAGSHATDGPGGGYHCIIMQLDPAAAVSWPVSLIGDCYFLAHKSSNPCVAL